VSLLLLSHEQKWPVLYELLNVLPAEELQLLERVLTRLEMDRLWKNVRDVFTQDWEHGKFARLDGIIGEVLADLSKRSA
jgi:hypothetical protein